MVSRWQRDTHRAEISVRPDRLVFIGFKSVYDLLVFQISTSSVRSARFRTYLFYDEKYFALNYAHVVLVTFSRKEIGDNLTRQRHRH